MFNILRNKEGTRVVSAGSTKTPMPMLEDTLSISQCGAAAPANSSRQLAKSARNLGHNKWAINREVVWYQEPRNIYDVAMARAPSEPNNSGTTTPGNYVHEASEVLALWIAAQNRSKIMKRQLDSSFQLRLHKSTSLMMSYSAI